MKKTTSKKAVKKSVDSPVYKVVVSVLGRKCETSGATVSEALSKINVRNAKNVKCIVAVERDGERKEKILMPLQTNRLLNSVGLMREIAIKNTALLFQGF